MQHRLLTPVAGVLLLLATAWIGVLVAPSPAATVPPATSVTTLNQMARSAQYGDEPSVRALVTAELQQFAWTAQASDLSLIAQDRITRSEVAYRAHTLSSISDSTIEYAFNRLAARLNAPDFAYTNVAQIRKLRLSMIAGTPQLTGAASGVGTGGSILRTGMAPSEAAWVTLSLIQQKAYNADFQVRPSDWDSYVVQKEESKRQTYQQGTYSPRLVSGALPPKLTQLQQTVGPVLENMSASARADLINATLDDLGIPR